MAISLPGNLTLKNSDFSFESSYIMALDSGTTSVRAVIVDEYGCIVAQASRPLKTSYPHSGWVRARSHGDSRFADCRHD